MDLLKCPSCNSDMNKVKEPDITRDRYPNCGATFLEKGEINILATGMAGDIEFCSVEDEVAEKDDRHPYRNCPKPECGGSKMRKIDLLIYSDTIFDYCESCGGFFLDKGEIKEMNLELESWNKTKIAEEFRDYLDDHLVCMNKVSDVMLMGIASVAKAVDYLRISVYFKKQLNLGLRIYSAKWTDKFVKLIGLFNKQDITTGDEKFDSSFIIQGEMETKIKSLLSSSNIQAELLDFLSHKFKMDVNPGTLEIVDKRVIYTEGPYTGAMIYDIKEDRIGIVTKMLKIASLIEEARY